MVQFLLETLLVTAIGGVDRPRDLDRRSARRSGAGARGVRRHSGAVASRWRCSPRLSLGLVGLVAGYFPARDASRLDPVVAMKL